MVFIISDPTSYLAEKGLAAVTTMLSKQRNPLSIEKCLRLCLTKMSLKIAKIVKVTIHTQTEHIALIHRVHIF